MCPPHNCPLTVPAAGPLGGALPKRGVSLRIPARRCFPGLVYSQTPTSLLRVLIPQETTFGRNLYLKRGYLSIDFGTILWYNNLSNPKGEMIEMRFSVKRYERRQVLVSLIGGSCSSCGFSGPRALRVVRKNLTTPMVSYATWSEDVELHPDRYELICANCTWEHNIERNLRLDAMHSEDVQERRQLKGAERLAADLAVVAVLLADGQQPLKDVIQALAITMSKSNAYAMVMRLRRAGFVESPGPSGRYNNKFVALTANGLDNTANSMV